MWVKGSKATMDEWRQVQRRQHEPAAALTCVTRLHALHHQSLSGWWSCHKTFTVLCWLEFWRRLLRLKMMFNTFLEYLKEPVHQLNYFTYPSFYIPLLLKTSPGSSLNEEVLPKEVNKTTKLPATFYSPSPHPDLHNWLFCFNLIRFCCLHKQINQSNIFFNFYSPATWHPLSTKR